MGCRKYIFENLPLDDTWTNLPFMFKYVTFGGYISEIVTFCGLLSCFLVYSCIMPPKKGGNKPEKPDGRENLDNEGYKLCRIGKLLANYGTLLTCYFYLDAANMLPNLQMGSMLVVFYFIVDVS